jgi:Resolvase, N terminal domain
MTDSRSAVLGMNPPTLPLDVYVRVSRVGGRGERLISPDEQEQRARALAAERGLKVGTVLTDRDESGGKLSRPGLNEALQRVERRESGGLIVAWLDRLSRDSEHALGVVRRITEAGGAIFAPDAPADWTTPEGELQSGIVFSFAQYVRSRARAGSSAPKSRRSPVVSRSPRAPLSAIASERTVASSPTRVRPPSSARCSRSVPRVPAPPSLAGS